MYKKILREYSVLISLGLILLITLPFIILSTFLFFNFQRSGTIFGISMFLSFLVQAVFSYWYFPKGKKILKSFIVIIGTAILFFSSLLLAIKTYDVSFDGMDYHQRAIHKIYDGWNPFYTDVDTKDNRSDAFLNSYSKASWFSSASVYMFTGNMESSKYVNYLIIPLVALVSFSLFSCFKKVPLLLSVTLSVLLSLNPVYIYQMSTLYVDSQVGAITLIWIFFLFLSVIENDNKLRRAIYLTQPFILIYAMNIKLTSLAYVGIATIPFLFYYFFDLFKRKNKKIFIKKIFILFIGTFFGFFVFGFEPYITNTIQHKNPFYPVYGESDYNSEFLVKNQMPSNFVNKNRFYKGYKAVFSRTENIHRNLGETNKKSPFEVLPGEMIMMRIQDTRVGGFGPYFGAIVIFSFLIVLISFLKSIIVFLKNKVYDKEVLLIYAICLVVFLSIIVNPEFWWARYAPQVWAVPILCLLLCSTFKNKLSHILLIPSFYFLLINIVGVLNVNLDYILYQRNDIRNKIYQIVSSGKKIDVYTSIFESGLIKFEKAGIEYRIVESPNDLKCDKDDFLMMLYSNQECETN